MKILNRIQYIVLYGIGLLLIGITSFISGGMGWNTFKDPLFYVENALTYAAIISVIAATMLTIIDRFKQLDTEYIESSTIIKNFARDTYVPSIFSRYCEYANSKRKRKQFIYNTKQKIYKLERKAKLEDLYLWNHDRERAIKENNIYCTRRAMLEEHLTDEWLDKNIEIVQVKFDHITASVILGGVFSKGDNFSPNDYITKHAGLIVVRDKAPVILFSFAITCLISSIIVEFAFTASDLISFFTKLFVLCYNTFVTVRYANNYNQTVTLKDIRFRKGIVKEYNMWIEQEAEAIKKTEADKEYEQMKLQAEANKSETKSITQKLLDSTPIGAVVDTIKEIKDNEPRRIGTGEDADKSDINRAT